MKAWFALIFVFAFVAAEIPKSGTPAYDNDNNALNYALTLEHLEATFYNIALSNLTEQNFADAGYNSTVYNWLQIIREHENMHVSAITAALQGRGATANRACTYNFPSSFNVSSFLQAAMVFEAVGASAYVGAISGITDTNLLAFAASVATVEARHSAFLNELNGVSPFPNATEPSLTPTQVKNTIAGFLASCPDTLTLPVSSDNFRSNQTKDEAYNNVTRSPAYLNDNVALNYALTLENLEAAFYNQFLNNNNVTVFGTAGINSTYYSWIQMIQTHENAHVAALRMVLASRGATPVEPCTYNFTTSTVDQFLTTARTLENVGVSAYIGAASAFSSQTLLSYAASIATVEARHAAFLNEITGQGPFPNATDPALTPAQVLPLAGQFITGCPVPIQTPVPADNFRTEATPPEDSSSVTVVVSVVLSCLAMFI